MSKFNIPPLGGAARPKPVIKPFVPPPPRRPVTATKTTETLGAEAFNKSRLGPTPKVDPAAVPSAQRQTVLPEAVSSGVHTTTKDLLQRFPLPLLPTGEEFVLRDWQVEDIEKLIRWTRVGVDLPVGSGKTVVATLVALAWGDPHVVVVLPPILILQWVRWLNSIGNSGGAVAYMGSPKKRAEIDLMKHRFWVMSDGIFKNDFKKLHALTLKMEVTLIKDEAQSIKNTGTDLWKKCNIFSLGKKLITVSGTWLNQPGDAYGYIKIKTPTIYRSNGHFEQVHVGKRDFFDNPVEWVNLELLHSNLYLQSVQRTKEEVHAHLPAASYTPFPYQLDPAHKRLYDQLMEVQIIETTAGGKFDATTANTLYTYAQQLVVNWSKFSGDPSVRPAIFDVIDTLAESIGLGTPGGPNKFLVWTWFQDTTRTIAAYLEAKYPGRVGIAYGQSDSQKAAERFERDPDNWWLVAQPLSAGAGWNPQYVCYNSLFVETPTRTIPFRQAAGRVDREGQAFNANIWIAQAEGTIQEFLYNNLLSNDALVQRVQGNPQDLRRIILGTL